MLTLQCFTVDARNPKALAQFWAEALGWQVGEGVNDVEVWIERELNDPNKTGFPDILFLKNSDRKQGKNRLHLDLRPDDQTTGRNNNEPIASKDETRESESRGTFRCNAVLHKVLHKSKVIPNKKAPNAIKANDWGLARDQI